MKRIIDIPEEIMEFIKNNGCLSVIYNDEVAKAIINGTPLPKGHGRLIDENELIDEIECEEIDGRYYDVIYAHSIYDAQTIIEADEDIDEAENE